MPDFEILDPDNPGEIPLDNDWVIRRKDIRALSSVTGQEEDALGTTGVGWLSDSEGGPEIHADLLVNLAAPAGTNIAMGTIQGDKLTQHLAARVGERIWEVTALGLNDGDHKDSVPLWIVPTARPKGMPR